MAGTKLAVRQATLAGLLPAEEADHLADDFAHALTIDDWGKPALPRLPTAVERHMLQRRAADVRDALEAIGGGDTGSPGGPGWQAARKALAALFSGYPSLRNVNVPNMLDTYLAWLGEQPAFAIIEACRLIGTNQARWIDPVTGASDGPHPDHPPSTIRMHALIAQIVAAQWSKVTQIEKVLRVTHIESPEPSEAERERVKGLLSDLAGKLRAPLAAVRDELSDEQLRVQDHNTKSIITSAWRAEGYEPMFSADGSISSPGMLKSMGKWPPAGAVKLGSKRDE